MFRRANNHKQRGGPTTRILSGAVALIAPGPAADAAALVQHERKNNRRRLRTGRPAAVHNNNNNNNREQKQVAIAASWKPWPSWWLLRLCYLVVAHLPLPHPLRACMRVSVAFRKQSALAAATRNQFLKSECPTCGLGSCANATEGPAPSSMAARHRLPREIFLAAADAPHWLLVVDRSGERREARGAYTFEKKSERTLRIEYWPLRATHQLCIVLATTPNHRMDNNGSPSGGARHPRNVAKSHNREGESASGITSSLKNKWLVNRLALSFFVEHRAILGCVTLRLFKEPAQPAADPNPATTSYIMRLSNHLLV